MWRGRTPQDAEAGTGYTYISNNHYRWHHRSLQLKCTHTQNKHFIFIDRFIHFCPFHVVEKNLHKM